MIKFDLYDGATAVYLCHGADGCGAMVPEEDQDRHKRFHVRLGLAISLEHLGGANDVEPLPPRG